MIKCCGRDFLGDKMKILPVFFSQNKFSDKGNNKLGFNQGKLKLDYQNQEDVFIRLAIASTRDKKIEQELKDMKLI